MSGGDAVEATTEPLLFGTPQGGTEGDPYDAEPAVASDVAVCVEGGDVHGGGCDGVVEDLRSIDPGEEYVDPCVGPTVTAHPRGLDGISAR